MRRVLLALSGTVAGLVMLLSFKSHPVSTVAAGVSGGGAGGAGSPAAGAAGSGTAGSGTAGSGAGGSRAGGSGAGSVTGSGQAASGTGSGAPGTGGGAPGTGGGTSTTATGQAVSTAFGPMQVQATLTGGRITAVRVLQETNVGARSQQIDAFAIPQLTKEALAAGSARIDGVSGASYTSAGYIQSLQSALDKARS